MAAARRIGPTAAGSLGVLFLAVDRDEIPIQSGSECASARAALASVLEGQVRENELLAVHSSKSLAIVAPVTSADELEMACARFANLTRNVSMESDDGPIALRVDVSWAIEDDGQRVIAAA